MIHRALFPARPLRTGLAFAAASFLLLLGAIYLPWTSRATTTLVLVGALAYATSLWFFYGPPRRAQQPEPPIPSQTQTPTK